MQKIDYTKLSERELEEKLKELKYNMAISYGNFEVIKVKKDHRKNIRREIARIKTELNNRKAKLMCQNEKKK